jgi:ribosomal protein S18 acetylase RimI-like enzyme
MKETHHILKDFSASALVRAIEANQFEYSLDLDRSPQITIRQDPELTWFVTGLPYPGFNRILRAQFQANDDVDARIGAALAPFRSRSVPTLWHVDPSSRPVDLGQRLLAHGFKRTAEEPGMAADLGALDADQTLPPGLRIEHIQNVETLKTWSQVTARAFDFTTELGNAVFEIEASLGQHPGRRLYLGILNGEPVAAALLYLGAGVAGIYGVGTIPEARRRGVGQAMTLVPLLEARTMGYRVGTLHSAPMGIGIYHRLGFREYCKLGRYVWRGNDPDRASGT